MNSHTAIKIISWNVNGGIKEKAHEIKQLIYTNQCDIILVQEAKATQEEAKEIRSIFKPFKSIMSLDEKRRHGNIIIMKKDLAKYKLNTLKSQVAPSDAIYTTLAIRGYLLSIANIYLSSHRTKHHNEHRERIIEETNQYFTNNDSSIYLCMGDFNLNFRKEVARAIPIKSLCEFHNLKIHFLDEPTHNRGNFLDYAICSKEFEQKFEVLHYGFTQSDHEPIRITINIPASNETKKQTKFSNINTETLALFKDHADELLRQKGADKLHDIQKILKNAATKAFKKVLLQSTKPFNFLRGTNLNRYKKRLEQLYRYRKFVMNNKTTWPQSFEPPSHLRSKQIIDHEIKDTREKHRQAIWEAIKIKKKRYAKNLVDPSPKLLFKIARTKTGSNELYHITKDDKISYDPGTVLHGVKQFFDRKQTSTPPTRTFNMIDQLGQNKVNTVSLHKEIEVQELRAVIKSNKSRLTPGLDGITFGMLFALSDSFLITVAETMSRILSGEQKIDEKCKVGYVTLLPKKQGLDDNELSDPKNYRPITVLPCLYRVFSSIVNRRLNRIISSNKVLSITQRGFVKGGRTVEIAKSIQNGLLVAKKDRAPIYLTLIDLSDAYGTVNYTTLEKILLGLGFPHNTTTLIGTICRDHRIRIKTFHGLSDTVKVKRGVPQGDPLSPTLFNLYTELISRVINSSDTGFPLGKTKLSVMSYADDITLVARSKQAMDTQMDLLQKICNDLELRINDSKTMQTGLSFKDNKSCCVEQGSINNTPMKVITPNESFKIVGYILRADGHRVDYSALEKEVEAALSGLQLKGLKPNSVIKVINAIVQGKVRYFTALGDVSNTVLENITKKVRKTLRNVTYSSFKSPSNFIHMSRENFGFGVAHGEAIALNSRASALLANLNSNLEYCSEPIIDQLKRLQNKKLSSILNWRRDLTTIEEMNNAGIYLGKRNNHELNPVRVEFARDQWTIVDIPQELLPSIKHCWTDASFDAVSGKGGGGIVWTDSSDNTILEQYFHIPYANSSTHAETITMTVAALLAPNEASILAMCDNKTTVSMDSSPRWAKNADIASLYFKTLREKNLIMTLKWVKGHADSTQNNAADRLAKTGLTSGIRADIYDKVRSAQESFYWTDGFSCSPNISQVIHIVHMKNYSLTRDGYETPSLHNIHPYTFNHWNSKRFSPLESNVLLKSRLDTFCNRTRQNEFQICNCGQEATLLHIVTQCIRTTDIRLQTAQFLQSYINSEHFDVDLTLDWTEEEPPPNDSVIIDWRGIYYHSTITKLRDTLHTSVKEALSTKGTNALITHTLDNISKHLAWFIYTAYKRCIQHYQSIAPS